MLFEATIFQDRFSELIKLSIKTAAEYSKPLERTSSGVEQFCEQADTCLVVRPKVMQDAV